MMDGTMRITMIRWMGVVFFLQGFLAAQDYTGSEEAAGQKAQIPKPMDFSKFFDNRTPSRDAFEESKRQKETKLIERLSLRDASDRSVLPDQYLVGPGDLFSLNIWGPMEVQIPLMVNPEGKLVVPSVGELAVDGQHLDRVQRLVCDKAKPFYQNCTLSLTLEKMRLFRVHVVGEVLFPGSYVCNAAYRVSEVIQEAGGFTSWAWSRSVQQRHPDGTGDTLDLALFEQAGLLEHDTFVQGGDVVYVPPISLSGSVVWVEGDPQRAGMYQIRQPHEVLMEFLQRIRAVTKNTDFLKITVRRAGESGDTIQILQPFSSSTQTGFIVQNQDRILLPSPYVFVKGSVQNPGAFPYAFNLTAKDYAGMAGILGNLKGIRIYRSGTLKTYRGTNILVEPGDVVEVPANWGLKLREYLGIASTVASLIIAAKAIGLWGE